MLVFCYYLLYSQIGTVRKLGTDWIIYDYKQALSSLKKITGISASKRIIIKRSIEEKNKILIKTETFYNNDDPQKQFQTLLKRGKTLERITLPEVPLVQSIKEKKLISLHKLLVELATADWRADPELIWMIPIFPDNLPTVPENNEEQNDENTEEGDIEECVCNEDDGGVKV